MIRMRGALYASMNRWIKSNHPELHRAILAELAAEERQLLDQPFVYNQFYDAAAYGRCLAAFLAKAPPGEFERLSTYLAEQDLQGVLRVFARLLSKEFLISRMSELWRKFYDRGEIALIDSSDRRVGIRVCGCSFPDAHRLSLEIYLRRMLELATRQTWTSRSSAEALERSEYWFERR